MFDMLVRDQFGTSQSGPLFSESWPEPRFNLYRVDAITLAVVAGGGTLRLIRQAAGEPPSFLTPTSEELLQSSSWRYLGAMVRGPQGAFRFYSPTRSRSAFPSCSPSRFRFAVGRNSRADARPSPIPRSHRKVHSRRHEKPGCDEPGFRFFVFVRGLCPESLSASGRERSRASVRRYRAGADGRCAVPDPRSSRSTVRSSRRCGPARRGR